MAETFLDTLVAALIRGGEHDSHDAVARVAVLWPDPDEQWRPLLGELRERLPVLTLGAYDPATLTGPAYYLRCLVARTLPGVPEGQVAVVYLPGVTRAAVRARDECPRAVLPLVELQYRGAFFSQKGTNEWTVTAFLQTEGGAPVAGDNATREAVLRSLPKLAEVPIDRLRKDAPLRAEWFDRLHHPDPVKAVLHWLNEPEKVKARSDPDAWAAFRSLARALYDFDPDNGPVGAGRLLGEHAGPWSPVWERFAESPEHWAGIPEWLKQGRPNLSLFERLSAPERWPQDNELAEEQLRASLAGLTIEKPAEARETVLKLEAQHGGRRRSIWARLGRAPLAMALDPLTTIARGTEHSPTGNLGTLGSAWAGGAWRVDLAVLDARACVGGSTDEAAVGTAARAMYLPWLDALARAFQKAVAAEGWLAPPPLDWGAGTCVLFSDGLRFDVAQRLADMLRADGLEVTVDTRRGALPGVTETGKPALMPIAGSLRPSSGFDVAIVGSAAASATAEALRGGLEKAGICVIRTHEPGDPSRPGWTECGDVDHRGHDARWDLGRELDGLLQKIAHRVRALLDAGWTEVRVVTDHGWLVVPGEFPKPAEVLPEHLTEVRKGRCARLKPSSQTHEQTVPWHFDPEVRVAVTAGAGCYEAGKGYEHGGLSPQECFLPVLSVRAASPKVGLAITKVRWKGLRVSVEVEGAPDGATIDVRNQPGDAKGWVGDRPLIAADGHATALVLDDRHLGGDAYVVVLSPSGGILAQQKTTVGAR